MDVSHTTAALTSTNALAQLNPRADTMDNTTSYTVQSDELPEHVVHHLVTRLASQFRSRVDTYNGARASDGMAVLGANHQGHLVTVVCAPNATTDALVVRVIVSSNSGAQWAVLASPVLMGLPLYLGYRLIGGGAGAVVGFLVGLIAAVFGGWGIFTMVRRTGFGDSSDGFKTQRIARKMAEGVTEAIESLGLTYIDDEETQLLGMDVNHTSASGSESPDEALRLGDKKAWTAVMNGAVSGIPASVK